MHLQWIKSKNHVMSLINRILHIQESMVPNTVLLLVTNRSTKYDNHTKAEKSDCRTEIISHFSLVDFVSGRILNFSRCMNKWLPCIVRSHNYLDRLNLLLLPKQQWVSVTDNRTFFTLHASSWMPPISSVCRCYVIDVVLCIHLVSAIRIKEFHAVDDITFECKENIVFVVKMTESFMKPQTVLAPKCRVLKVDYMILKSINYF